MSSTRRRTVFRGSAPALFVKLVALAVVSAALTLTGPAAQTATAAPASTAAAAAKIKPKLSRQLEAKGKASFWVRFDQADLSSASKIKRLDRARPGRLRHPEGSRQREPEGHPRAAGRRRTSPYQAFWATNAIRVQAGDSRAGAEDRTPSSEVESRSIRRSTTSSRSRSRASRRPRGRRRRVGRREHQRRRRLEPVRGSPVRASRSASIDTGTQFDHPALVDQYRGNNGDGTFDHNYNWFDAAGSLPRRSLRQRRARHPHHGHHGRRRRRREPDRRRPRRQLDRPPTAAAPRTLP